MHLRPVVRLVIALITVFLLNGLALWSWTGAAHAQSPTVLYVDDSTDDGLVAHWQFDQSGGTVTTDFRNLITATVSGATTPFTTTVIFPALPRPNPRALSLNPGGNPAANDDYLTINDAYPALNRNSGFTIAGWIRREAEDNYDPIYDSGVQTGTWWIFVSGLTTGNANNNKLGFGLRNVEDYYATTTIPADGFWRHVAVVVESAPNPTVRFYINGVAAGTATVNHEINMPVGIKHIGAFSEPGATVPIAHFDGLIDELRFYNRALTAEEVQRLGLFRRTCVTTGASWAQAFPDLHCALEIAAPTNQIWVAKGHYYPRVTSGSTDTFVTFGLKNSVAVYGNFDGDETTLDQRPSLVLTDVVQGAPASFLTADFQGNDDLTTFANTDDNLSTILGSTGANSAARLDGFVIQGARALDGGGVAAVTTGGSPTYENLIFWANRGAQAMRNTGNSSPSLQNIVFYQNLESTSLAGRDGVLNNVASQPRLTNVQFISNTARMGGAMVNDGGVVRLAKVQFLGNTAGSDGGAVAVINGSRLLGEQLTFRHNSAINGGALILDSSSGATITNTHFLENRAGGDGGALYNEGDLTVVASSFLTNVANFDGGGLLNTGELTIHTSRFAGNEAAGGGGILNRGTMEASQSEFQRNAAGAYGGIANAGPLLLTHTRFISNTSEGNGGGLGDVGMGASSAIASLSYVTFTLNTAGGHGGGLYVENGGALLVAHGVLEQNSAAQAGGALYALTSTVTLSDVAVLHNEAQTDAGGLYLRAGQTMLHRVRLVENRNGGNGGGLLFEGGLGTLDRTLLHGNVAQGDAGGLAVRSGASLTSTNTIFVGNTGSAANAIDVEGATLHLINSSLAGHSSPGAAGVRVAAGGILTAANVIFWDSGAAVVDDGAADVAEFYNSWGAPGSGVDPRFARTPSPGDGDWRTAADNDYGDLHLRGNSPAIDAGDGARLPAGITADFDGAARIVDGPRANATDLPVDQGAFETSGTGAASGPGGPYQGSEGTPVNLAATGDTASAAENGTSFAWDCAGDGSFEADGPAAVCTYPDDGTFNARLRVSEDNGLSTVATTTVIVANVAPTVTLPAGQNGSEGLPQSFSIGNLVDPGADAPWTVTIRWGDGQPDTTFTVESAGPLPAQGHTYADDSASQGAFTVEVSATDKDGATAAVAFPIVVANQPPVAADDQAATAPDTALLIDVLVNDADVAADPLTLTTVETPAYGLAEIQGQQVRYSPAAGFQGTDTFTYTVSDDEGGTARATVTVTVGSPGGRLFLPMLVR